MLQNSILATNYVNGGPDLVEGITSLGYNFIGESDVPGEWLASDQVGTVGTFTSLDPLLVALHDNGGPTFTMRPYYGPNGLSPVINTGKSFGLTTDQRGFPRPCVYPTVPWIVMGGDSSDIGAYELQTTALGYDHGVEELSWSKFSPGFLAESANSLSPPAWTLVPGIPQVEGDQYVLPTGSSSLNSQFFRLILSNAGGALSFDGLADYVSIAATTPVPPPWTAEFWVNRQNATDYSATLLGDASTALKLEQFDFTRQVGFTQFGVADYTFNYSAPVGVWVHLAFVSDTTTRLYVNGQLQDTIPVSISLPMGRIGDDTSGNSDHARGIIDEVRLWNVARTQAQIQSIMNHTLPVTVANLIGYWKFDAGSGTTSVDSSGQGKTGTLLGLPTWVDSTAPILP